MNSLDIKIVDLPKITDPRGNLTFAEAQAMVPFDIKRAYWVYDVPGGESRGVHSMSHLIMAMNVKRCCLIIPGKAC